MREEGFILFMVSVRHGRCGGAEQLSSWRPGSRQKQTERERHRVGRGEERERLREEEEEKERE